MTQGSLIVTLRISSLFYLGPFFPDLWKKYLFQIDEELFEWSRFLKPSVFMLSLSRLSLYFRRKNTRCQSLIERYFSESEPGEFPQKDAPAYYIFKFFINIIASLFFFSLEESGHFRALEQRQWWNFQYSHRKKHLYLSQKNEHNDCTCARIRRQTFSTATFPCHFDVQTCFQTLLNYHLKFITKMKRINFKIPTRINDNRFNLLKELI